MVMYADCEGCEMWTVWADEAMEEIHSLQEENHELGAENERLRTLLSECGDERSRLRRGLARWRTGLVED